MRNKWIYTIFVLVLGCFAACSDHSDDQPTDKGKTRTVVFRLSVDDAVGSRAAWGENYTAGDADVPFDTRINLDGLQVVVYDANNRYVGKADNVLYWSVSGNENDNTKEEYEFVGDLSHLELDENINYKLMLFANCPEVGEDTNIDQLSFDIDDEALAYPNGAIPMWGLKQMSISGTSDLIDLGVIDLLRAVAKVEVVLADNLKDIYSLSAVTANVHNEYGYCVPSGWTNQGVTETKHLDQETSFHPYRSVRETLLTANKDNAGKHFIYLTEFDHTAFNNSHDTKLSVTLEGLSEFKDAISFTELNIPHIVRNHIYRFTIEGVHAGGLELEYQVADWDLHTFNDNEPEDPSWNLNFDYPTYLNPLRPNKVVNGGNQPDNGGDGTHPTYTDPVMTFTSASDYTPFICWLQLIGPKGSDNLTWNPYLAAEDFVYANIEVYKFDFTNGPSLVYDTASDSEDMKKPLEAYEDGWYMIQVIPKSAENKVISLRLTYHQSWMGTDASRSLLINGPDSEHIAWPNSGNDPYVIEITLNKTENEDTNS